ncbi:hypothetical protein Acsp06_51990 [Actinomycetospora sp. NBRC 106375]|uniref:hypothetical protein n=1 Tax=Actinomycetospora sp. NBRC 106375 TaxID=3032207 RepID=UPI0024A2A4E1|nr:hypothetical protein [Actinomycetospora sp. NBRC 106375]GLZ49014.1 hypothetical protein Acsp06_51990 [Actinomycetospora sp. NBRC 106375]
MAPLLSGLLRGTAAGAAGTTALNVATQADMALRARPASGTPTEAVAALADRADVAIPGGRRARRHRLEGLGGLAGTATGLAVGGVAGVLRSTGVRLPAVVGGPLLGAAAMLASDLPAARLDLTDPRRWAAVDWAADAVPHLAYGLATHATLAATFRADDRERAEHPERAPRPATAGTLARAAALGAATGARSTFGVTALALRGARGRSVRGAAVLAALGEAAGDKHPAVPPRTHPAGLAPRLGLAATSAGAAAHRDGREVGPGALVAVGAALGAAVGGMRLRGLAHARLGTDLPGALAEDAVAALLAGWGARRES